MSNIKEKNKIDIFQSVKAYALNELTPEILETGFDLVTESDLLKDIPIFGIGFKGYSLYKKITESFFTKKLLKFLIELKEIPLSERIKFIDELEYKNNSNKAGEKLLIILNRLNDDEKATIVGRLLRNTIIGKLEYKDFTRLTHIIDRTFIEDLKLLENNYHLRFVSDDIKLNLHQVGIVKQSISDIRRQKKIQIRAGFGENEVQPIFVYKISDIGSKLIQFGFESIHS